MSGFVVMMDVLKLERNMEHVPTWDGRIILYEKRQSNHEMVAGNFAVDVPNCTQTRRRPRQFQLRRALGREWQAP